MSIDDLIEEAKAIIKKRCSIEKYENVLYIKAPKGIYLGDLRLIRFIYPNVDDIRIN